MERTTRDGRVAADPVARPTAPSDLTQPEAGAQRDAEALLAALRQAGIHLAYREAVRRCVDEPDAQWRFCCGSSCDPCVEQIGRAVDAYRSHLAASGRPR